MKMLKMCLNPKVLAALVVLGVAVYLFAPGALAAALPLLVLAACPLSMLLMMAAMRRGEHQESERGGVPVSGDVDTNAIRAELARLQAREAKLLDQLDATSADTPHRERTR